MSEMTPDIPGFWLTPDAAKARDQAVDVVLYYAAAEKAKLGNDNLPRKVTLAKAAIHTSLRSQSILPNGEPLLTHQEQAEALRYLTQPDLSVWPVEPTVEQLQQIEDLSEKQPCSVFDAYCQVMQIQSPR